MAIFLAGLQGIPRSYYEAATIDGARKIHEVVHITLPLVMPAVSINVTSNLIGGLRVFEQVLGLTNGGPGNASQVISTLVFRTYSQGYYARAAAMGLIQIFFTLLLGVLFYTLLSRKEVEL